MSDAISHSHRAEKLRKEKERREEIIKIGFELTEIRAQREALQMIEQDLESQLDELLKGPGKW